MSTVLSVGSTVTYQGFKGKIKGSKKCFVLGKSLILFKVDFEPDTSGGVPLAYRCENTGYSGYKAEQLSLTDKKSVANDVGDLRVRRFLKALEQQGFNLLKYSYIGSFVEFEPMSGSLKGLEAAMAAVGWVKQGKDLFPADMNKDGDWAYYVEPNTRSLTRPMLAVQPVSGIINIS